MPTSAHRPKDRKASIALAAAELFCARGFHNVGNEDIAAKVGITGPALYRHFPSKQAILTAAVAELVGTFAERVHAANGIEDPGERLRSALCGVIGYTLDRRSAARLYQWEGRHLDPADRATVAGTFDAAVRGLRDMLRETRPELSARDATLLINAALSVIASPATHRTSLARAKIEQTIVDSATAVLAARLPAPRRSAARDYRPELLPRRERLLIEAMRLFHERGFHAVGMADIGEAAGISASSCYAHFSGKADLLAAAYYRATNRLEQATAEALLDADSPAQAIGRLVDTYVRFVFEQADLAAVYVSESENLPPKDRHELRAAQRRHVDTWITVLSEVDGRVSSAVLRFRVHAALNVAGDLARSAGSSATLARTTALVRRVLGASPD
jgi:AcrR family transcriptional regulator